MKRVRLFPLIICALTAIVGCGLTIGTGSRPDRILIDHTKRDLSLVPESAIELAKETLYIAYDHTSHGSQLKTGMDALMAYPAFDGLYSWGYDDSKESLSLIAGGTGGPVPDLSQGDWVDDNGDTPWVVQTRALLNNPENSNINVVMFSWCSINGHDAQRYVDNMEKLIAEYPDIVFIFMTGHAEGDSENLAVNSVHYNNELIREHCEENERHLYDFADIEAYNPNGVYYWDRGMRDNLDYDRGNWAVEWIAANSSSELAKLTTGDGVAAYDGCQGTAHSDSPQEANLNGVLKGMAAWSLWASIAVMLD